ncbi:MAG: CsgG/HfaB family protein [Sedimentisphaerales bacterium]
MKTLYSAILAITLLLTLCIPNARATSGIGQAKITEEPAAIGEKPAAEKQEPVKVSVAIIDFESQAPGNPELGTQLSDILTARLSIYDQFQLVERKKLEDLLREHELNLTGMVDTPDAITAGKLIGAKILIFGRAFAVDRDLYIVTKIVGTETSQVKGTLAKGSLESNLSDIIDQLATNKSYN